MTLIKTCGISRMREIDMINDAQPDFCGFIVDYPASHRSVSLDQLPQLRARLDAGIKAVGVFVQQTPATVAAIAKSCKLDVIQLHGDQDEAFIAELRNETNLLLVQAFVLQSADDIAKVQASSADYVLVDSGRGSGKQFDWDWLLGLDRPYFLAGGLTPDTLGQAIEQLHPYAVDLSSGVETEKRKDARKIRAAVQAVRQADTTEVPV